MSILVVQAFSARLHFPMYTFYLGFGAHKHGPAADIADDHKSSCFVFKATTTIGRGRAKADAVNSSAQVGSVIRRSANKTHAKTGTKYGLSGEEWDARSIARQQQPMAFSLVLYLSYSAVPVATVSSTTDVAS